MKRLLAFILAGAMVFSTPIMAAENVESEANGGDVSNADKDGNTGKGENKKGSRSRNASDVNPEDETTTPSGTCSPAVEASSVPAWVVEAAAAEGKTVGEYMNNAVASVPGLDYVVPVGQGGHVVINGAPSNQVFSVLKPALSCVYSAKAFATSIGGRLLNVVRINASITGFQTARVNFYMKGVTAGQNVKVFQNFNCNGQWLEVEVVEVRQDHVVVNMTALGTLAFIEMPK